MPVLCHNFDDITQSRAVLICPAGRTKRHACKVATSRDTTLQSEAERFVEALENTDEEAGTDASQGEVTRLQEALSTCQQQVGTATSDFCLYRVLEAGVLTSQISFGHR